MKRTAMAFLVFALGALGENFSDVSTMTDRQRIRHFVKHGAGVLKPKNWLYDDSQWITLQPRRELPKSFDLRAKHPTGQLHPIKRQQCGDCWAHAILSVLENQWALAHPDEPFVSYAQQELISTCRNTGGSCNGGYFNAFNYALGKSGPGLPLDKDLPYKGYTTSCKSTVAKLPRGYSWAYIGRRGESRGAEIDQMKEALLRYGTLSVTVKAFNHAGAGVYKTCSYGFINHMVNIEGWVDDPVYNGGGYWLMRNSWGTTFGENGYAKVAYLDQYGRKCANLGEATAVLTRLE